MAASATITAHGAAPAKVKKPAMERLKGVLPEIWELVRPRKGLMGLGLLLMAINRVAGLVLPASTKFLVDDVILKKHTWRLHQIVIAVIAATIIQGITSFSLTQLLSKAAQRLIADMRRQIQEHVGRLPIAYYDSTKTGTMVARILSDVEGVRNLIGTGLVDFLGGLLTAVLAFIVLIRISVSLPVIAFVCIAFFGFALKKAFC